MGILQSKFNKMQIDATSPVVRHCLPYMEMPATHIKTVTRLLATKKRERMESPLHTSVKKSCALLNSPSARRLMTSCPRAACPLKVQSDCYKHLDIPARAFDHATRTSIRGRKQKERSKRAEIKPVMC